MRLRGNDFLFGKQIGDAGIDVRYKSYAYRWDYSYAAADAQQVHDRSTASELFTGSYNLSINAEHATFENLIHLRGATYAPVVAAFEANFERLWIAGRTPDLLARAAQPHRHRQRPIPLVFDSMALSGRR